ncbi:TolC family protein [Sulfurospirillum sp. hDNRA2]|uniref:TolC family protein n=1 Tax=Sulfurospirillum sp. hDNRA2 TaxID=3237298 RepID=UPI0020B6EEE5|nr:TolC family protein [Sulfurospirillum sp. DNRA8]MCP3653128.1 TolC family protein [Sulfurospirillum sp. DNRA8]MCR1811979.1 TolC family protein [Sulfurospirillum sp. DNRA8]
MRLYGWGFILVVSLAYASDNDPFETHKLLPPSSVLSCENVDTKRTLSLEDIVNLALCRNPQTQIAWQSLLYQAALVGQAKASFLPTIDATGSSAQTESSEKYSSGRVDKAALELSYLLYDFGKRDANEQSARQLLNAAAASNDGTVQAVFLEALQAYYSLFGSKASLNAAVEAERYAKESLSASEVRLRVGTATQADMLQAKTAYSQAVLTRIKAEGNLRSAQGTLASVLGFAPDTSVALFEPSMNPPTHDFEKNVHTMMDEAQIKHPDLLAAEATIKAKEADVKAAKADGKPYFSLSSSIGHTDSKISDQDSRVSTIGLYVTIPIFTGYATKYKVQAAKEQLLLSKAQYEKTRQDVALNVYQTYQTLVSETQTIQASQDTLISAEASHNVALGRYKAGVGSILDLLSAQSALANAKQEYIQALYNWYIEKATLAKAIGVLNLSAIKGENE